MIRLTDVDPLLEGEDLRGPGDELGERGGGQQLRVGRVGALQQRLYGNVCNGLLCHPVSFTLWLCILQSPGTCRGRRARSGTSPAPSPPPTAPTPTATRRAACTAPPGATPPQSAASARGWRLDLILHVAEVCA